MAAKPKISPDEWAKIRAAWESDTRDGYAWLIDELKVPITRAALRKVALKDKWAKVASKVSKKPVKVLDKKPVDSPDHRANKGTEQKVSGSKVSKVSKEAMVSKVSVTSDTNGVDIETTKEPDKHPGGRPTLYKEDYVNQVYRLCLLGATDEEIAEAFDVNVDTIYEWKKVHEDFSESIKKGKLIADSRMAESLYKRGIGYSHPDVHISNYKGEITVTPIIKYYPPDTPAGIFWMKNRRPKQWKDKVEIKEEINLNLFPPKEELDDIYAKALGEAKIRRDRLVGRADRLGLVIDNDTGDVADF